ncbi:MAG: type 4a pilus biogenesis protein PilO [Candidatus Rokubacteria bacterium]|nr:type 4a pilus biogenesis protein PilO [Candidatus Rokubacteria bacterium]
MELPAAFDPIVNAPRWQKVVIGLVPLVLIGAGAYFLLLKPLEDRMTATRAKHASLQTELNQNRAIAADLARFRREAAELEKKLEALKEKLPTEKETPPLYRTLSDAATQSGLAVSLFQPREPRTREFYSEIPIVLNAEGGYHQLGEFLERVAGLPRVVTLAEWKLTGQLRQQYAMKAELILATYMYRPVGSVPPPKPGAAPIPKPPAPAGTAK